MIIRKKRTPKDLFPTVALICDEPACEEREDFSYGTEPKVISHWMGRHGWSIKYKGHGKFHHRCSICERHSKAPAAYYANLHR